MCRTSESHQPLSSTNLSATSFTLTPPIPESSSSSSPVDRLQPLHRESLCPLCDAGLSPLPHIAASLTMSFISGVHRCVVFTGSEDPRCSCSGSTRGNTSLAPFPPTPECTSYSLPADRSQPRHRESLRPSDDAGLSPPRTLPNPLTGAWSAKSAAMFCVQGRRTLIVLVLGRREEAHRFPYFLRRRSVCLLHLRLKVLSLCIENYCSSRATRG